ncbi:uncharacterized protein TEOVI_000021300 [Trypanosoma equiperdum]|uniref:Uncharacterized protein n=1 Tax=Trypanosoma equiperdum TaxID=5694 RepID=A0A1G4I1Q3_TRYEQ|nr:hypothetical protein, conserved [Trypanosoma equiperdum]
MVLWELCKPPFFSFFFLSIPLRRLHLFPLRTPHCPVQIHFIATFLFPLHLLRVFFFPPFKHSRYCYHNHQHHHGHYYIITITIFQLIFLFYSLLRILMTATAIPSCWLRLRLPAFSFDVSGFIRTKGRKKNEVISFIVADLLRRHVHDITCVQTLCSLWAAFCMHGFVFLSPFVNFFCFLYNYFVIRLNEFIT